MEDNPVPPRAPPPASRLTPEQQLALRHPIRRRAHDAIRATPGLALIPLARHLGVSWGMLAFHLRGLARVGLVTFRDEHGHRRVYPAPAAPAHAQALHEHLLRDAATRALAAEVCRAPGRRISEVAASIDRSPCTTHHHAQRLSRAGLLATARDHRLVPSPELQRILDA